jgi:phage gp36-like protein
MYVTQADLIRLFGMSEIESLSQLDYPGNGTIDTVRVEAACEYATQEIDCFLTLRYSLPIASVPMVLTNKAADIARYQLEHNDPREDVRKRYEDAIVWLNRVAAGKAGLGLGSNGAEVESDAPTYSVEALHPMPVFTDLSLSGY